MVAATAVWCAAENDGRYDGDRATLLTAAAAGAAAGAYAVSGIFAAAGGVPESLVVSGLARAFTATVATAVRISAVRTLRASCGGCERCVYLTLRGALAFDDVMVRYRHREQHDEIKRRWAVAAAGWRYAFQRLALWHRVVGGARLGDGLRTWTANVVTDDRADERAAATTLLPAAVARIACCRSYVTVYSCRARGGAGRADVAYRDITGTRKHVVLRAALPRVNFLADIG